jgi:hypothetical protein
LLVTDEADGGLFLELTGFVTALFAVLLLRTVFVMLFCTGVLLLLFAEFVTDLRLSPEFVR